MGRFKKYEIEKGKHSIPLFKRFGIEFDNRIECEAYFDESALIVLDGNDKYDINKLFGFSNTLNHHNQSARVGWRCVDGEKIDLFTYVYNNKKRVKEQLLGSVEPYEVFKVAIIDIGFSYNFIFEITDKIVNYVSEPKTQYNNLFYMKLFPYFGGNQTAPHDITIFLKFL